jgi:hypothetical protein
MVTLQLSSLEVVHHSNWRKFYVYYLEFGHGRLDAPRKTGFCTIFKGCRIFARSSIRLKDAARVLGLAKSTTFTHTTSSLCV